MAYSANEKKMNQIRSMLVKEKLMVLDLGSDSIKALEVIKKGKDILINSVLEVGYVGKFFEGKDITNHEGLLTDVSRMLKTTDTKVKKAELVYNSSSLQTKVIRVPDMSDKEIKEYVDIEYHKSFSNVSLHTHILDYHQFGLIKEDDRTDQSVLIATVPISESTKLMKAFESKGLNVKTVETNINALVSAMNLADHKAEHRLILHMGKEYSLILFNKGGTPIFYRMFPFGYGQFTRKLQDDLQTSLKNVEHLVKGRGFSDDAIYKEGIDVDAYDFAVREEFGNFVTEVYRSINYVKMQTKFEAEKIFLSGGMANMKGIVGIVEENAMLPAEVWTFKAREIDGVNVLIKGQEVLGPEYALALGLSVRGWL